MRRFIVKQNIGRFEQLLGSEQDTSRRSQIEELLAKARRELSSLERIWLWTYPALVIPDAIGLAAERLLDKIVKDHQANFGSLQIWGEATNSLRLIAHSNFDRASVERFAAMRNGDGTACEVVHTSLSPVIVEDLEKAEEFASLREWTRGIGIQSIRSILY
jgi:hypothetical protein